ncbi:MAG: hypothetical protein AB7L09_12285 [Nitrospira sp.]
MPTVNHVADPESMNSYERAHVATKRARALLSSYPNVVSVGVGTKRIAGVATETWCVSVSVRAKLPADQLPASTTIPADIDGVPTDVTETGDFGTLMQDPKDGSESYELNTYRPLRGGIKLGTAWSSTSGIEDDRLGMGTLGCVVLTNEKPPRHVALTNRHVVADVLPNGPVGQPHADPGSTCCGSTEMIGNVYAVAQDTGEPPSLNIYPVDAALCSLTDKLTWIAGIATGGSGPSSPAAPILGTRDLKQTTPPPPPNLRVKKRGARTGLTTGTVEVVSDAKHIRVGPREFDGVDLSNLKKFPFYLSLPVLGIRADDGPSFAITAATKANPCQLTAPAHTFKAGDTVHVFGIKGGLGVVLNDAYFKVGTVAPAAGTLTLRDLDGAPFDSTTFAAYTTGGTVALFTTPFGLEGDSGSVVCDMNDNVIGLLFGGTSGSHMAPGAYAWACHIADVITTMKITVPVTAATAGVQTVPAKNNPYKAITSTSMTNAMAKLQNDLLDTEHGVVIARAMLAHENEVRALIRTNRRVAARWRHVSNPQLVEGFVAALFEPSLPVVGVTASDAKRALNRFADALARYASARLNEDLAYLRDLIVAMVDLNYRDIIASLGTHTESQPANCELVPADQIKRAAIAVMGAIAALVRPALHSGTTER